ncbi:GNAT family N-acetyltransferase [Kangsaoukella pontilimi]|uniref:GNAT family N-acetyltransferase n=1 Tax=Kangsaoukella pontilimi TaxID=2691042 RepID=UPI0038739DDF
MTVRAATPDDAGQVALILNHYIRHTTVSFKPNEYSDDAVRSLIEAQPFWVAEADDRVIGYATYGQFRNGPGYARTMEHTILMAPDAKGKGAGRALMATLERHARDAGAGSLWAGVSGENPEGLAFHKAIGFEEVAVLEKVGFKFGRWLDLTLLRKWLAPNS